MKAIHAFLLVVAGPVLLAPVDPVKSITEIHRVVTEEAAFMAFRGEEFIGTIGIVMADWWYSQDGFLTDRWCFVLPEYRNRGVFDALIAEADLLAGASGVRFVFNGKAARRSPRTPNVIYTSPRKLAAEPMRSTGDHVLRRDDDRSAAPEWRH